MNNDLISREDLRKAFHERIYYFNKSSWDEANAIIDNAPTVDTTEEYLKGYLQGCEDTIKKVNELQKIQVHIPYGRGTKMERSEEE